MQTSYVLSRKVGEKIQYLECAANEMYFTSQLRHAIFFETWEEANDLRGLDSDLIVYKVEIKIISSPM